MEIDQAVSTRRKINRVIAEGDTVVIVVNNDFSKSFIESNLKHDKKIKLFKTNTVDTSDIIGVPYDTYFELDEKTKKYKILKDNPEPEPTYEEEEEAKGNNQTIVDDNAAQTLSHEDIENLKKQKSGKELVDALVQNSKSFENKTQFSQQKYLNRKKKKYQTFFKVVAPSLSVICESYFERKSDKICHMRIDTLSQFLVLGNVFSHTQALVFETCSGLIVSAVLERMGPRGHIIRVAQDNNFNTHTHIVQLINQPTTEVRDSMITSIPFSFFGRAKQPVESRSELKDEKLQRFTQFEATLIGKSKSMMCDSMLIATNSMDHQELFTQFWPLLQPSGTFAIYSSFREPLQLIYSQLRTDKTAVLLQLSETWMREFQVLPHRTHPHMKTSSASGYILSGIKVINS